MPRTRPDPLPRKEGAVIQKAPAPEWLGPTIVMPLRRRLLNNRCAAGHAMAWEIRCSSSRCGKKFRADIVEIIKSHLDQGTGRFLCSSCGREGFVEKNFRTQEGGNPWRPYLRGIVSLGKADEIYQPLVFLVSYEPRGKITDLWFSYYKDLRESGGRLKFGYGPGGPPVLGKANFLDLLTQLVHRNYASRREILKAANRNRQNRRRS